MKSKLNLWIGIVIISFIGVSCGIDDDYQNVRYSLDSVKIDSVRFESNTMNVNTTQVVNTYETIRRNCEGFYKYDYQIAGNQRNVVAYLIRNEDVACGSTTSVSNNYFNFRPQTAGVYLFKFWAGTNEDGEDLFIEQEILVE